MLASLLALVLGTSAVHAAPPPFVTPSASPLDRVVLVGASLTDGYGMQNELGHRASLATFLDASLTGGRSTHACVADSRFFIDPERTGPRLVQRALAQEPSLVVALDFLFWYVHGDRFPSEKHRLESLEEGLALLERFRCPLVVADVPDVRIALKGKGPLGVPMIYPQMIPKPNTLHRINKRIQAWVEERGGAFVRLNRFLGQVVAKKAFALRGNAWPPNSLGTLLQADLMHPSAAGYLGVLVILQDAMARDLEAVRDEHFRWKVEEIETSFRDETKALRRRAAEKARAREERRQKRRGGR